MLSPFKLDEAYRMNSPLQALVGRSPLRISVILIPNFSLMAFSSLIEPARNANLLTGKELYVWRFFSELGAATEASLSIPLACDPLEQFEVADCDILFLVSGLDMEMNQSGPLRSVLREAHRHGTLLVALSTATFFLAAAGLLNGRACTVHLDYIDALREHYPQLTVRNDLYVIDGPIITCSGGIAAMDLMLHIIEAQHGGELARRIAQQFMHRQLRSAQEPQSMELTHRYGVRHQQLLTALQQMEESMQEPVTKADIARDAEISPRQLERLFRSQLGVSPARFYLQMRLDKAQRLLRQTGMSVTQVAVACGFESASHFSKCYRERFGTRPSQDRNR